MWLRFRRKIKRHLSNFKQLYFRHLRISVVTSVLLIMGAVVFTSHLYAQATADQSTLKLYRKQMDDLSNGINALPSNIRQNNNVNQDLNRYFDELDSLLTPCGQMTGAYNARIPKVRNKRLKDTMDQTNKLCGDLKDVSKYSQNIYAASQNYLYYQTNWPSVSDQNYPSALRDLDGIIKSTKDRLQHVDSKNVQDPGLSELTALLDNEDQMIMQIQNTLNQNKSDKASLLSDQFAKQFKRDQINFLNARIYYWNNTIEYNQLQKAVAKLKNTFDSLKI
jgi:ElaB/YqjD/DUF883 family membrane-anchored ribosome-binding protein